MYLDVPASRARATAERYDYQGVYVASLGEVSDLAVRLLEPILLMLLAGVVLILVIAYTTLVAPFWIKWYYRHHAAPLEPSVPEEDMGYPLPPDVSATGPPGPAGAAGASHGPGGGDPG